MTMTDDSALFSLLANLNLTIGRQADLIEQQERREQDKAKRAATPTFVPLAGALVMPSTGFGVIDLGGPTSGFVWYVRRLVVGGLTPTTTAAGRADVFVSAMSFRQLTALSQVSISDWADQTATLPNIAFYGHGEIELRYPERLQLVLSSATSGQDYVVGGLVENIQESAAVQGFQL